MVEIDQGLRASTGPRARSACSTCSGPPPADRRPLHVPPLVGGRLPELHRRRRRVSAGLLEHLARPRHVVRRRLAAPLEKLERYKAAAGLDVPVVLLEGSDFNYDFHVTLDESVAPVEYNYRTAAEHRAAGTGYYVEGEQPLELPGTSCFLRDGDRVFHTYSSTRAAASATGGAYYFLDLTALGRQEEWEEPKGRAGAPRRQPGLRLGGSLRRPPDEQPHRRGRQQHHHEQPQSLDGDDERRVRVGAERDRQHRVQPAGRGGEVGVAAA